MAYSIDRSLELGSPRPLVARTAADQPAEIVYSIGMLDLVALTFLVFGAVNWGLVALLGVDPVGATFGGDSPFTRSLQALTGLSALYLISATARLLVVSPRT